MFDKISAALLRQSPPLMGVRLEATGESRHPILDARNEARVLCASFGSSDRDDLFISAGSES
jgi:hypothetical protein